MKNVGRHEEVRETRSYMVPSLKLRCLLYSMEIVVFFGTNHIIDTLHITLVSGSSFLNDKMTSGACCVLCQTVSQVTAQVQQSQLS